MRRGRPLRPALSGWRLGIGAAGVLAAPFLIVFLLLAEFDVLIDDEEEAAGQALADAPDAAASDDAAGEQATLLLDQAEAPAEDLTLESEQPQDDEPAEPDPAPPGEQVYTVVPGDTLAAIAVRFGTSVRALAAFNEIVNVDRLDVGQQIRIPPEGYEPPPEPAPEAESGDEAGAPTG